MTPKFDYVVCSIDEFKDIDTLTIDELQLCMNNAWVLMLKKNTLWKLLMEINLEEKVEVVLKY